ncbi:Vacuolar fusion protein mon1 [Malassezia nana]|uniref:Vacuolar fusion protein MON1 n=1 Tax=Malassezia nana TaxID=180528 RepID=A0AAF0EUD1_9BASI|nr:Vacuolar fusion protein mon1 [Malassezia nana]
MHPAAPHSKSGPASATHLLRRAQRNDAKGAAPTPAVLSTDAVASQLVEEVSLDDTASHADADADAEPTCLYMVLSHAGKLVYVHGDDAAWGGAYLQAGVLHAMLTLFGTSEELQYITLAPSLYMAFFSRMPLHVVAATHCAESPALVRAHLERVYAAVLSLFSAPRLDTLFAHAPNIDLQGLMGPMAQYIDAAVVAMHASLAFALDAVPVRALEPTVRAAASAALVHLASDQLPQGVLYLQLWDDECLLCHAHPRHHTPSPTDLSLLHAMVRFGAGKDDLWAPLCLPRAAPHGFVYVYASRISKATNAPWFVLVCADRDGQAASRACRDALSQAPSVAALCAVLAQPGPEPLAPVPGLRDVAFVSRRRQQCIVPSFLPVRRHRLYAQLLQALRGDERALRAAAAAHDGPRAPPVAAPLHMVVQRTAHEALLGWRT